MTIKTASAAVEKWRALSRVRKLTNEEKCAQGRAIGDLILSLNPPKRRPRAKAT